MENTNLMFLYGLFFSSTKDSFILDRVSSPSATSPKICNNKLIHKKLSPTGNRMDSSEKSKFLHHNFHITQSSSQLSLRLKKGTTTLRHPKRHSVNSKRKRNCQAEFYTATVAYSKIIHNLVARYLSLHTRIVRIAINTITKSKPKWQTQSISEIHGVKKQPKFYTLRFFTRKDT